MFMSDWLVCMKCNSLTIKDASNMMRVRRKIGGYIVSHLSRIAILFKMKKIERSIVC